MRENTCIRSSHIYTKKKLRKIAVGTEQGKKSVIQTFHRVFDWPMSHKSFVRVKFSYINLSFIVLHFMFLFSL